MKRKRRPHANLPKHKTELETAQEFEANMLGMALDNRVSAALAGPTF